MTKVFSLLLLGASFILTSNDNHSFLHEYNLVDSCSNKRAIIKGKKVIKDCGFKPKEIIVTDRIVSNTDSCIGLFFFLVREKKDLTNGKFIPFLRICNDIKINPNSKNGTKFKDDASLSEDLNWFMREAGSHFSEKEIEDIKAFYRNGVSVWVRGYLKH